MTRPYLPQCQPTRRLPAVLAPNAPTLSTLALNALALNALALSALALTTQAAAQQTLTLPAAVARATTDGPEVSTARADLRNAEAEVRATRADPSPLITTLTQAEQAQAAALANLQYTKLTVAQQVVGDYLNVYELTQSAQVAEAQAALDGRRLEIARARLQTRTGTPLDVSRAEADLNASRETLSDTRAQLPVARASLARTLGLGNINDIAAYTFSAPPQPPKLSASLASLEHGLETRLPSLVQAANGAEFARLQVRISDNDYTPRRTLEDARTTLQNAERSLTSAQRGAKTSLRDAYRAVQAAEQQVVLARQNLTNAKTALTQDETRLKAGTIAQIEVEGSRLQLRQSELNVQRALAGQWRALSALSVTAGRDVTGLVN